MARRRGRRSELNFWPGFVDGLSTLLLVIIFLLSIFMIAQFYLGRTVSTQSEELRRLTARIAQLTEELGLAEASNEDLTRQLAALTATLADTEDALAASQADVASLTTALAAAETRASGLAGALEEAEALSAEQQSQIALLNQQLAALRQQLASLQQALEAAEAKDAEQQAVIADLGRRLNQALARKVQELADVRSRFFEALLNAIGDRDDIQIVGDRFIFASDILFGSCSDVIAPGGQAELDKLARILLEIRGDIPADIAWVLRVDGHADQQPLGPNCRLRFDSNWHLSASRAISVVRYLNSRGVPANRLMAAGFGEFQPLVSGTSPAALARNRRIEFKLTER